MADSEFPPLIHDPKQSIRELIIDTLRFVGTEDPARLVLTARIVELLVKRPQTDISDAIAFASSKTGRSVDSILHIIDKVFDIYDKPTYDRITSLTRSMPFTSRDALCDIALYVRTKYYSRFSTDERFVK